MHAACVLCYAVQWVDELQRHTKPGSLSIKVYSGQPQAAAAPAAKGSSSGRSRSSSPAVGGVRGAAAATAAGGKAAASNEVVTAAQLAAADIVLTTFDIIRREVALQPQTEGAPERSLRHRKRYAGPCSANAGEIECPAVLPDGFCPQNQAGFCQDSSLVLQAVLQMLLCAGCWLRSLVADCRAGSWLLVLQVCCGAHPAESADVLAARVGRGAAGWRHQQGS